MSLSNEEQPSGFNLVLNIVDIISLIIKVVDDRKLWPIC